MTARICWGAGVAIAIEGGLDLGIANELRIG